MTNKRHTTSRIHSFPLKIFLLALVLRLMPVLLFPHLGIGIDMFQYDMLARSLAAGNGFRWFAPADAALLAPYLDLDVNALGLDPRGMLTTFRAPLYPAFLALVYMVFGVGPDRFFSARVIQASLGALLAPMTYVAALRILENSNWSHRVVERSARGAAVIVASYPMLVLFPLGLATENLFFLLLLGASSALLALSRQPSQSNDVGRSQRLESALAVLAGVLLGMSALTRSVVLPFALLALFWIWLDLRRPRATVLAALALACTLVPWITRNSLLSDRLTGIETSMGYNLYLGYHPESTGTFTFGPSLDLLSILDDRLREQVGTEEAVEFIRENPGRFPYLALRRLGHFFDLEWRAFMYFYDNGFLGALSPPVLLLILNLLALPFAFVACSAVFGAASMPRSAQTTLVMLLVVAYLLPHVFILSEERFHLALIPFFAILAATAWAKPVDDLNARRMSLWLAAAGVALLILNWSAQIARTLPTLVQLIGAGGNRLYLPY